MDRSKAPFIWLWLALALAAAPLLANAASLPTLIAPARKAHSTP